MQFNDEFRKCEMCFAVSVLKNSICVHSMIFYTYNCAVSSKLLLHNLFNIDQMPSSMVSNERVHVQQYSRDCFQSFDVRTRIHRTHTHWRHQQAVHGQPDSWCDIGWILCKVISSLKAKLLTSTLIFLILKIDLTVFYMA